jgi:hypothetical protein
MGGALRKEGIAGVSLIYGGYGYLINMPARRLMINRLLTRTRAGLRSDTGPAARIRKIQPIVLVADVYGHSFMGKAGRIRAIRESYGKLTIYGRSVNRRIKQRAWSVPNVNALQNSALVNVIRSVCISIAPLKSIL